MNRAALLIVVALAGCLDAVPPPEPKAQPPQVAAPAPPMMEPLPAKPTEAVSAKTVEDARVFDFKGDTPGVMTLEQFTAKYPAAKTRSHESLPGVETREVSASDTTIANVQPRSVYYAFENGTLATITLALDDRKSHEVEEALIDRYGRPQKVVETPLVRFTWSSNSSEITSETGFGMTLVVFGDSKLRRSLEAKRKAVEDEKKRSNAKDL